MKRSERLRFAYKLGAALGVVNVERDILQGLTWKQFRRWHYYSLLEPFGEIRADYRTAQIVQIIANVNRDPKKSQPIKLEDALLRFKEEEAQQQRQAQQQPPSQQAPPRPSQQELLNKLMLMARMQAAFVDAGQA